ncbi:hypothetical protein XBJ2_330007 [Xenorhabdus bovienii str. Jollieti]|uniref:Uncharacterized protein n=1 Tax=Xenorhabdus bovienii (strain SS-2004) TaxID=406818 RepID=D3UWM9_XENBS|nr:hypothetical protein XBJ1_0723 [Xenorhabdus bovienii SS-2004]CDH29581.1 hypothetical protein XBJ2_330007 [Xenorhabdus bovienii str. Jollieti]
MGSSVNVLIGLISYIYLNLKENLIFWTGVDVFILLLNL